MSILIRGMDMPDDCKTCDLCHYDGFMGFCFANYEKIADEGRREDCPIIEVLPHGDLIDRKEVLENAGGVYTARPEEALKIQHEINKVLFAIKDAPAVIEAEE